MNRNKLQLVLALAIAIVLPACAYGDLINYWTFDSDGSDSVGSNAGTLQGDAAITSSVYMIGSGGVAFDGDGDYVEMAGKSIDSNIGNFSVSMWVQLNTSGSGELQSYFWEAAYADNGVWLRHQSTYLKAVIGGPTAATNVHPNTGTDTFYDGTWHQVTITGTSPGSGNGTSYGNIYIDGVKYTYENTDGYDTTATTAATLVGAGRGNGVDYFVDGYIDDTGVWNEALNDAEATALYSLGSESTLRYGAGDAEVLFDAFDSMSSGVTSDGKTWEYVTGLTGAAGTLVNGGTALVLDASGNGVSIVPEPGTLALLACGLLSLLAYAWRKRK